MTERIYVWMFMPSAVRDGYQIGAYARHIDWRFEEDRDTYDAADAAEAIWAAAVKMIPNPIFFSAEAMDAPNSADLCVRLNAKASARCSDKEGR